jgi:hypothetical protein
MHKAFAFGALAALALSGQAFAADDGGTGISYNYLEASYIKADIDGISNNPDGFGLNASVAFTPMFHGYVDYTNIDTSGITVQNVEIGLGLNHSISPMVDLVGRLGFERAKVESLGHDSGFGAQAGILARPAAGFEVDALLHYVDFGGRDGDNTSVKLAGRYFFAPQFSVGLGAELDDDVKLWSAGFRWTFK